MSSCQTQTAPQVITIKSDQPPTYAFLAFPPPPAQKKRPTQPLPSPPPAYKAVTPLPARRRSNTFSTIASWAAHVQPGSPASLSPRSPRRRPSIGRGRRPSITSIRATSGSFLNVVETPTTAHRTGTPSVRDFKADLTAVGYTSVFLQLPNTPISATLPITLTTRTDKHIPVPATPSSPNRKPRTLSRFRSLSVLKRGRSKSAAPPSPVGHRMKAKEISAAAVVKRKKAKYAMRPAPLANELALMQFADGGDMDSHIKRIMEQQAKAIAGPGRVAGVSDVYRDGEGGIWWDQEEEWEYAHLLSGNDANAHGTGDLQWVTFANNSPTAVQVSEPEERRGSVSTQDSDLDPRFIVHATDHFDADDLAAFGSALAPISTRKPGMSVLSLPARPRRAAKHLRKPDFLVDAAFSRALASPKSPKFAPAAFATPATKPKGKARRRPAPLNLSPPSLGLKRPTNSPVDADKIRQDFLGSSFAPAVPGSPAKPRPSQEARGKLTSRTLNVPHLLPNDSSWSLSGRKMIAKKPSRLNVMGLFKTSKREEAECTLL
ncbi:hypothetical protein BJ138DRAFT_153045 [Hygrophoropsis aurantiaca]|uniref:Uncharacterized protein n=1 Tax=Hygrophoropsis aurantiaca TaxID=72124 RepID=A0ACB8AAG3_9AGAM|nr:hypothetical protein BJ138DRAFT_153045 [Hygrophoropsis aurantiaca]